MNKILIPNTLGYEVMTPTGWHSFAGVATMGKNRIYQIIFENDIKIECSPGHRFFVNTNESIRADSLEAGAHVMSESGLIKVISCTKTDRTDLTYSLIEVESHNYFTNGIQSANCSFVTDDETLINPLTFPRLNFKDPEFFINQSRWYAEPQPNRAYLVALDPSTGTEKDYAAIQVFQIPEMIQIAEWQANNMAARLQMAAMMDILYALDSMLRDNPLQVGDPDIFWSFENNGIGEGVLTILEHTNEDRFPGQLVTEPRRKGIQVKRVRRGLNTNPRNKLSACARLKSLVESDRMTINSHQLLKELKNFVRVGNTFKAKPGTHDDLTLALLMVVRMLDIVSMWGTNIGDLKECISEEELFQQEPMPLIVGDDPWTLDKI